MKTIILAIDNYKIYEEIKKEKKIKILGRDLIYKEAIIEILEKNNNIDFIFLYEKILGNINLFDLIKKIKNINKKIKIIVILENKNEDIEKKLKKINIKKIFLKNKINSKKIIEIILDEKTNLKKEESIKEIINKNRKSKNALKETLNIKDYIIKRINTIKNLVAIKITINKKSKHNSKNQKKIVIVCVDRKNNKIIKSLLISKKICNAKNRIGVIDLSAKRKKNKRKNKLEETKKQKTKDKRILKNRINNIFKLKFKYYKILKNKINNNIKRKYQIKIVPKKINNNIIYFINSQKIFESKNINEENNKILLEIIKKIYIEFDYIILIINKKELKKINYEIIDKTNKIIQIIKPTYSNIKETNNIIKKIENRKKCKNIFIYITINKTKYIKISPIIIKEIFKRYKSIKKIETIKINR